MTTPADLTCLARIRARYHPALVAAAAQYGHRVEVLAGILMRESRGGEALDSMLLGDGGHGHGLMQIDDRSFPAFCQSEDWRDPDKNITFGASVLDAKRSFLSQRLRLAADELERAAIAAYNCGEGRVLQSYFEGEDLDTHTAHGDYSRNVLELAQAYAEQEPKPEPIPEPEQAQGSWLLALFQLFARLFKPRSQ